MPAQSILWISDDLSRCQPLFVSLRDVGYEIVSTSSSKQATALLFVMRSVDAVIIDQRSEEHLSFDLARNLRSVRPDVPVILLCRDQVDHMPAWVDACVPEGEPLGNLGWVLETIVSAYQYAAKAASEGRARYAARLR